MLKGISATTQFLQSTLFSRGPPGLLFLCKDDIVSPNLYSHLPMLAFLNHPQTILVTLPRGSKTDLRPFIHIESQASCVFLQGTSDEFNSLYTVVSGLAQPVQLPGVSRSLLQSNVYGRVGTSFLPAQIKTIETSAPIPAKRSNKDIESSTGSMAPPKKKKSKTDA